MEIIRKTISKGIAQIVKMNGAETEDSVKVPEGDRIKSCFCVPMIYKNRIVGALYHDYCLFTSSIKESDLATLSYFAGQAAIALDNARAYEQINRLNEKLKGEKEYYLEQHLQGLQYNDFIGKSAKIQRIFDQVNRVAKGDTTVLILGETGVGKELLARIIHRESLRQGKPFIRTDCSTFSPSLIASELFGHERGAFTGATYRRTGLFELANGGTLFLDEISNTPMEVQMQLLRVLQTHEFQRVGGVETIHSNFRLITASNRDLREEVKAGRFREDLFYRLNVFPIVIPPLRDRKDDIPLLSLFFLKKYASRMRKPLEDISKQEMDKLMDYDWPGNIRELQHIIERGVILSSDSYFRVPELATHNKKEVNKRKSVSLNDVVRDHIIWALEKSGGKISGKSSAAELLDINYGTLRSKMKKLGINVNRSPESA
jgi:transcriptional regulator with GAF, ATPase, and Fis domain